MTTLSDPQTGAALDAVRGQAEAYCAALHRSDTARLAEIFHENAHLYAPAEDGTLIDWPLPQFLERVGSRPPGEGAPDYAILSATLSGAEMAFVHLEVSVPPRRFADVLVFLKLGDAWRINAKTFRVAEGPAV
ncbi:MAG: nuclear transport factor 2 family protein [Pseudomonadota bacterium]